MTLRDALPLLLCPAGLLLLGVLIGHGRRAMPGRYDIREKR